MVWGWPKIILGDYNSILNMGFGPNFTFKKYLAEINYTKILKQNFQVILFQKLKRNSSNENKPIKLH